MLQISIPEPHDQLICLTAINIPPATQENADTQGQNYGNKSDGQAYPDPMISLLRISGHTFGLALTSQKVFL